MSGVVSLMTPVPTGREQSGTIAAASSDSGRGVVISQGSHPGGSVATIALMQERTIRRAEELTEQLQGALTSRVVIEQAKGAVAALRGISIDEAFELLRTRARSNQRRLVDVAQAVLDEREGPK
jgi:AmiR/NasT family two-component response regulator